MDERSKLFLIARATHEANRVYCAALGDTTQVPWDEAPGWQRRSALDGVKAVLDGSASTPQEQHEAWESYKRRDGWTYGATKDPILRTHPCLLPYAELPASQRAKDEIFRAVARGVAAHLEEIGG